MGKAKSFVSAPRIYYFVPYHPAGLGRAYNECCELVQNPDDWICLMDSDIMFFSSQRFGDQLSQAIAAHPEYSVFTCVTNRMCGVQQMREPGIHGERDLVRLKRAADERMRKFRGQIENVPGFFAGYFMAFPKKLWTKFPFPEIGSQGGKILGIDSAWSHTLSREGIRVGCLKGLMAVHFYRLDKGEGNIEHLPDKGHNPGQPHEWSPKHYLAKHTPQFPPPTVRQKEVVKSDPTKNLRVALNPNIKPPCGYKFTDEDGLEHVSTSTEKLVANIAAHRARLNKPPGNPLKEFTEQVYARWPQVCYRY
jgi:hypothetical protein